jgi:hypothetical protein
VSELYINRDAVRREVGAENFVTIPKYTGNTLDQVDGFRVLGQFVTEIWMGNRNQG